ncbi:MAG TPA: His/Gly/Thr/Pro-type tRNA ligase C-terminal domain-containing protein, partial [Actinomycetota bacterium]|nr:His/Gly/Thr/Pro-type tRNA ligase C-terminal domain-containing protein [Actinomycetota bacterium]
IEALMRDRKALQAGTSHYLGQNFAKAYGVSFLGRDGQQHLAEATSWGASTRLVGGLIMAHGDDAGLRLPPAVAPIQLVVVPIARSDEERARVLEAASKIVGDLVTRGLRCKIDDREGQRPGFKFAEWELRGVPLRVELGPRDLDAGRATVARRDTGDKDTIPLGSISQEVPTLLEDIQSALLEDGRRFTEEHTFRVDSYDALRETLTEPGGFVIGPWCGSADCEAKVKEETKATIRYLPLDPIEQSGKCVVCGSDAVEEAAWAQAY